MNRPLLLIAFVGFVIIVGVTATGYYIGKRAEQRGQASPSPSTELPTPSPSPTNILLPSSSPSPVTTARPRRLLPTAPPQAPAANIQGAATAVPKRATPRPKARAEEGLFASSESSSTTTTTESSTTTESTETVTSYQPEPTAALKISFVNVPSAVSSGETFTVEWRVEGPTGTHGSETSLHASYATSSASDGASSSQSSSSEQSFGSFTIPEVFSTQLSYGGSPGAIQLLVTAVVEGKTLESSRTVELR